MASRAEVFGGLLMRRWHQAAWRDFCIAQAATGDSAPRFTRIFRSLRAAGALAARQCRRLLCRQFIHRLSPMPARHTVSVNEVFTFRY